MVVVTFLFYFCSQGQAGVTCIGRPAGSPRLLYFVCWFFVFFTFRANWMVFVNIFDSRKYVGLAFVDTGFTAHYWVVYWNSRFLAFAKNTITYLKTQRPVCRMCLFVRYDALPSCLWSTSTNISRRCLFAKHPTVSRASQKETAGKVGRKFLRTNRH